MNSTVFNQPVRLRNVISPASFIGCGDLVVRSVSCDTRSSGEVDLFACLPGSRVNGDLFAQTAVDSGAKAILAESPLPQIDVPQCIVRNAREAFGLISHALAGNACQRFQNFGVTGTNGKTTTTWMLRAILQKANRQPGLLGTIQFDDGRKTRAATHTTPDPGVLASWFQRMAATGCRAAIMEVSSHALQQHRIAGIEFDVAVVTNITQDHLDYHVTFDNYLRAKAKIADYLRQNRPLIWNADDTGCRQLVRLVRSGIPKISFGISETANVRLRVIKEGIARAEFQLDGLGPSKESARFELPMPGLHNIYNAAAAAITAVECGVTVPAIINALRQFEVVPGRLEPVPTALPIQCFVDYAHTPDALHRVLESMRKVVAGRLICVFGAGGDRDTTKRPLLGQAAMSADLAIVTSDNPRSEDPEEIIRQVISHAEVVREKVICEVDRRAAIRSAIQSAEPGDCVVICGKGHEATQTIGEAVVPFDDRLVLREILNEAELRHTPSELQAIA